MRSRIPTLVVLLIPALLLALGLADDTLWP
jgi:hypothetical protein